MERQSLDVEPDSARLGDRPATDSRAADPDAVSPGWRRGWSAEQWFTGRIGVVRGGLLGVGLLGFLVAVWAGIGAAELRGSAAGNTALADAATTQEVTRQVGDAVAAAFSYDYTDLGRTEASAGRVLTGSAMREFDGMFGKVKDLAPTQRAVLTTTARSVGLTDLHGDTATALVLVDQQILRGDHDQHGSGSAELTVHVQRFGADWKITDIQFG